MELHIFCFIILQESLNKGPNGPDPSPDIISITHQSIYTYGRIVISGEPEGGYPAGLAHRFTVILGMCVRFLVIRKNCFNIDVFLARLEQLICIFSQLSLCKVILNCENKLKANLHFVYFSHNFKINTYKQLPKLLLLFF